MSSMYEYLEREQQREIEADWEGEGEIVDWAAERAEREAERQEHALYILQRWLSGDLREIGTPLPRSTWEAL